MTVPDRPRIGIFGGTFDPIHLGHLIVAAELRFRLDLDRLIFLPAGRPPHKQVQRLASPTDRLTMLDLALAGTTGFEVCTLEVDEAGLSYTSETLAMLRTSLGPCRLFFLMGSDSLRDFPGWHDPTAIADQAELGVAARPNVTIEPAAIEAAVPATKGRIHLVPIPLIEIASRDIRQRIAAGETITFQVPRDVEAYILEHGLYRP